jgi:beta-mannosidase
MLLSLLAPLPGPAQVLDGEWRIATAHEGGGVEEGYADPGFADSAWEAVRLPHLRHSTAEQDTLWYRCHFAPDLTGLASRVILRFGGAFYRARAWLNGVELGLHEGYFQPFGFDVTGLLKPGDNVLAVRCRFPIETGEFRRKTAVAGIFADWDCKPYPSAFYPNLPPPTQWTVPIGLWQPVSLHTTGPVLIESFNIFPLAINPDWQSGRAEAATLKVVLAARNLTAEPQTAELALNITPHNFVGQVGNLPYKQTLNLAGGEHQTLEFNLTLPQPRLWFPWTHGEPHLYQARLTIPNNQLPITKSFGIRNIQALVEPGRWEWQLNGRRIFPKGSNYVSDFYLNRVTPESLCRDLDLARNANLDLLRVHAHIAPPDFYRLCDELGVMVMCDFPLIWTYAFDLPPDEDLAFRASVQAQVEDMVRLLGSHPAIALWSMHNEPPWTPDGSFLGGDVHKAEVNRLMDEASAARARELDSTRPVIAASGEYDQHLYHGWYTGSWQDNRNLHPTFPTEFGVQALPNLDSPFWTTANTNWPVDSDDPGWAHAGYQAVFWAGPGVGAPSQFATLADYVAASQAYQAFFTRYVIDQWRRKKFDPVGGYIHFLFTDGWPAITWAVLDYYRLPKAGYQALAESSRPVHLSFDVEPGFQVEGGFHLVYPVGATLVAALHLVNDDYRLEGQVAVSTWIERRDSPRLNWLRRLLSRRVITTLPRADERSRLVTLLKLPLKRAGEYTLRAQVRQGRKVLAENRFDFRAGAARHEHKPPRRVPGLLLNKVYQSGSLRHTEDGFAFSLRNPAMPVTLQSLSELRVDGQTVDPAQVELVFGGQSRRASTITPQAPLEIPSNERFAIVVRGQALAPGAHELELTAHFFGLGDIVAKIKDKLI